MAQASLGEMIIRIVGDTALFDSSVDKSKVTLNNFYKELEKADAEFKKLEESSKRADLEKSLKLKEAINQTQKLGGDLTKFVTLPILALGTAAVKVAGDFEQQRIALGTLLGSVEKGNELFETLRKEAAATPFELKDLVKNTTTLKAFGVETENLLPYMRMLGDVALGDSNKFSQLNLAFAQIKASGKLMGQDLLQLINAGFNPLQVISEKTGRSISDLKNDMSNGAISFEQVADAFKSATSEGGKFYKASENASKTLNGQISTLKDNFSALLNEFGEALIPTVKDLIKIASDVIAEFNKLDEGTKKTIITVAGLTAAIGPVLSVGAQLVTMVTTIGSSFAAVGAVGGPILVVAASLGVLINEVLKYKKNAEETIAIQQGFIKVMDGSKQSLDDFKKSLVVFETSPAIIKKDLKAVNKAINETQKQIDAFSKGLVDQGPTKIFTFESERTDPLAKQRQEVARLREELDKLKATRDSLDQQLKKVAPAQKEEIKTYETMTSLQDGLLSMKETELEILSKELEQKGLLLDVNSIMTEQIGETLERTQEEADAFNRLTESYKKYTDLVASATGPVFEALGAALVTGEAGWKNFAKAGLDAVAAVVDALANMAIAETAAEIAKALASYPDPVGIAAHSAAAVQWGAAGALGKVVAGAIRAIPFKDGGYVTKPTVGLLAEAGNPEFAIPDRPNVTDILATRILNGMGKMTGTVNNVTNNNQGFNGPMVLSIDGQQFKAYINQQSAKGNIQISPKRGIAKR